MRKKAILSNYSITRFLISVLLSGGIVFGITQSLYYNNPFKEILLFVFLFLSIYHVIFMNRLSVVLCCIAALLTSIGVSGYLISQGKWNNLLHSISVFARAIYSSIQGYEYIQAFHQNIIVILLCASIGLIFFFLTVKNSYFKIVCILGIVLFSVQWSSGIFASKTGFYVFSFATLLYYFDDFYQKRKWDIDHHNTWTKAFTLWLILICGFIFGASLYMNHYHQIQLIWLHDTVTNVSDFMNEHFAIFESENGAGSQEATVNFDDEHAYLGGAIYRDQTIVLQVDSPRVVYLKGAVKDYYDGISWKGTMKDLIPVDRTSTDENLIKNLLDVQHTLHSIPFLDSDPNYMEKYFYTDNISITFKNISSKSIFIPQMTKEIQLPSESENQFFTHFLYDDLLVENPQEEGFSYEITALTPRYNDASFKELLRRSKTGILKHIAENSTSEQLQKEAERYYDTYLQIPDSTPSRVTNLAASITKDLTNNYDKVKALEQYLAKNYTYNLAPPEKPDRSDFVDHFLFESKEGYCTYYASALTILVRSLGIPARYVEGYLLPAHEEPDEADYYQYMLNDPYYYEEDTSYTVRNEQAHAWTEVYFEGFGWLVFEPTSPFEAVYNVEDYSYTPSTIPDYGLNNDQTDSWLHLTIDEEFLRAIGCWLFVVSIPLLFLIFFLYRKYVEIRSGKRSSKDKILWMYRQILIWLNLIGYPMDSGETPIRYAKKIDQRIYLDPITFQSITDIFVRTRYSSETIQEEDLLTVQEFHSYMKKRTRQYIGNRRYLMNKLLKRI